MIVYVLTRTGDGDAIVDGVFTTEKKAEKYKKQLIEEFCEEEGDTDWEIHSEIVF